MATQFNTRSKYLLMLDGIDKDKTGVSFPDVMSLPVEEFTYNQVPYKYTLAEYNVYRFDQLMLDFYGRVEYYQPMVMFLNKISYLDETMIGVRIVLPTKQDLDNFFITNILGG